MNKDSAQQYINALVTSVCSVLSDQELMAFYAVVQLDYDPHGHIFDYETVRVLFTEDGDTRLNEETKSALADVVRSRLG